MLASIVIRTYNESRHLPELLEKIASQNNESVKAEVVIVDSGSTDGTLDIAEDYDAKIVSIDKEEFTFGLSLNIGCDAASGEYLVFVSGHCIPENNDWLERLVTPLKNDNIVYSYGRQIGNGSSRFSEFQLFNKYFPVVSAIPQEGFFCNNANAALRKDIWEKYQFDESLTGLEDMELGRRLVTEGFALAYVSDAAVFHLHDESWHQVKMRYLREAVALRHIIPEIQIRFSDFLRFYVSAILMDSGVALKDRKFWSRISEILLFRLMQYWGSYRGNHTHRQMSAKLREEYFYPK